jgi:hypothetical protein
LKKKYIFVICKEKGKKIKKYFVFRKRKISSRTFIYLPLKYFQTEDLESKMKEKKRTNEQSNKNKQHVNGKIERFLSHFWFTANYIA